MYTREELIKMGFAYVGKDVKIYKKSIIINPSIIHLGDGCQINDFVFIGAVKHIHIGKRCHIPTMCSIIGYNGEFILEDYANLTAGCRIILSSDDFLGNSLCGAGMPIEYRKINSSNITIKKHAVLGTNSIVLPGVTIAEGTASTVSTVFYHDTEPWCIYKGNPAQKAGRRRKDIIIKMEKEMIEKYGY